MFTVASSVPFAVDACCGLWAVGCGSGPGRWPAAAAMSHGRARLGAAMLAGMSIVKINAISVPEGAGEELERRFAARAGSIDGQPGFEGFQLLRPTAGEDRYFVVTHWADEESYAAWRDGDARAAHAGSHGKPVASGANLLEFDVVMDVPGTK